MGKHDSRPDFCLETLGCQVTGFDREKNTLATPSFPPFGFFGSGCWGFWLWFIVVLFLWVLRNSGPTQGFDYALYGSLI